MQSDAAVESGTWSAFTNLSIEWGHKIESTAGDDTSHNSGVVAPFPRKKSVHILSPFSDTQRRQKLVEMLNVITLSNFN